MIGRLEFPYQRLDPHRLCQVSFGVTTTCFQPLDACSPDKSLLSSVIGDLPYPTYVLFRRTIRKHPVGISSTLEKINSEDVKGDENENSGYR